jgi:hypothetical protein
MPLFETSIGISLFKGLLAGTFSAKAPATVAGVASVAATTAAVGVTAVMVTALTWQMVSADIWDRRVLRETRGKNILIVVINRRTKQTVAAWLTGSLDETLRRLFPHDGDWTVCPKPA